MAPPARSQKRLPRHRALRRRLQTMSLENPRDRRSSDLMSEALERTLNAGVVPRRIVLGHAHDESANLGQSTTTAGSLFRIRPLARDQLPVPAQQRVGRNDRRQVRQGCPAQPVGTPGEPPPIIVRQSQAPSAELPPEEAVLFDQISERRSRAGGYITDAPTMAATASILSWDNTTSMAWARNQRYLQLWSGS